MVRYFLLAGLGALLLTSLGCDIPQRITRLEKANQDLQAQVIKIQAASDYDLQARCSKDARAWFKENWSSNDKDQLLLDFTNHYNKSQNKCFIFVEYHYRTESSGSWINNMTLWDVYENEKYGTFAENHIIYLKPKYQSTDEIITCELFGKKCTTVGEFNGLANPYMNN